MRHTVTLLPVRLIETLRIAQGGMLWRARASSARPAAASGGAVGFGALGRAPRGLQGGAGAGSLWLRTPLVEIHLTRAGFLMPFRCAL